jgi:hypothetical protein
MKSDNGFEHFYNAFIAREAAKSFIGSMAGHECILDLADNG